MGLFLTMIVVVLAMLVALAVAGLVVAYVAFVQRGQEIPRAPWLTGVMNRTVQRWGVRTEPAEHEDPAERLHVRQGGIRRSTER